MRIAFVGKGGSGKTTMSSLFIEYIIAQKRSVFAIDADINQHLGEGLGISEGILRLLPQAGNELAKIKEYCIGENKHIANVNDFIKTTPPGNGSRFISLSKDNPDRLLQSLCYQDDFLSFLQTGSYTDMDIGTRCYHAKTGGVEII